MGYTLMLVPRDLIPLFTSIADNNSSLAVCPDVSTLDAIRKLTGAYTVVVPFVEHKPDLPAVSVEYLYKADRVISIPVCNTVKSRDALAEKPPFDPKTVYDHRVFVEKELTKARQDFRTAVEHRKSIIAILEDEQFHLSAEGKESLEESLEVVDRTLPVLIQYVNNYNRELLGILNFESNING